MFSMMVGRFAKERQMSPEVAKAIFEAAGHDVAVATRLADEPTPAEQFEINNRAFDIAGDAVQTLEWGLTSAEMVLRC